MTTNPYLAASFPDIQLYTGNALDVLASLPEASVHMVVTSPPYFSLRKYAGVEPDVWGGDPSHDHQWIDLGSRQKGGLSQHSEILDGRDLSGHFGGNLTHIGESCACGAWLGSLGNEPRADCEAWMRREPPCASCYTCHIRSIFAAVHRVLRPDSILLLNIGDSYAGGGKGPQGATGIGDASRRQGQVDFPPNRQPGFSTKDLLGIPQRVVMALQRDGWIWRSEIVWAKTISLPESVTDRPSSAHEKIYLLSKADTYYYDEYGFRTSDANLRNFWLLGPDPNNSDHFAAFVRDIPRRAILLGSSESGVCATCGNPWKRVVERISVPANKEKIAALVAKGIPRQTANFYGNNGVIVPARTVGWEATCAHNADRIGAQILDLFGGSGTTALVARSLGRRSIYIDRSPYYTEIARNRIEKQPPSFLAPEYKPTPVPEKQATLFGES